ncbi:MAG: hypothetical protein IKZ49_00100 [Alphaproteobacteria bacterium]|nr:hypothetical protein [Alphaproteobacteria bacterium]
MNLKTSLFVMFVAIPSVFIGADADAKYCNSQGKKASAGHYCKALTVFDCEPGCYCTGGGNFTWAVGDVPKGCKNRWSKVTSELNSKGVYLCPSDYPNSAGGASKASDCYTTTNSGAKVYYKKTVKCDAGKYLPAGEVTCSACQSDSVCSGGSFDFSKSSTQGLTKCSGGQVPNAKHTACENQKITCSAKKYLPAKATSCASCPSRYYLCVGGSWSVSSTDQGIVACKSGQIADYNRNQCVNEATPAPEPTPAPTPAPTPEPTPAPTPEPAPAPKPVYVNCVPGTYLKANETNCSDCANKPGHYCIGGTYPQDSFDQGATLCPENSMPNDKKTACEYGAFTCEPGTYLPAKGIKCIQCSSNKNYCPGGTWKPADFDQGLKICPLTSVANPSRTACILTLSKAQLQYGMSGKIENQIPIDQQCWNRKTMAEYVYCMFGGKINVPFSEPKPPVVTTPETTDTTPENVQ